MSDSFSDLPAASLSRRSALLIPLGALFTAPFRLVAFAASHFWEKEDPASWTAAEISQLTTNSPWAKQVTAELNSDKSSRGAGTPRMSSGRGGRRGGGGGGSTSNLPKFQAVVCWASAAPVREAQKLKFPAALDGHYVISVSGLPIMSGNDAGDSGASKSGDDSFSSLKEQTSLQIKRGEPVQPGVAYQYPSDRSTIYFGFLPELAEVSGARTATFSMSTGPLAVKAKFNLEEMKYRGKLAV